MATTSLSSEISPADRIRWYRALFEEDCRAVMKLLNAHRHRLLNVGWEPDPGREVEGRRRREGAGREKRPWKGRTALHVGASRGCIELILLVLGLCDIKGFASISAAYRRTLLDQTGVNVHPNPQESDRALAPGPIARTITRRYTIRNNVASPTSSPDVDVKRLFLAKDGESGLDALAIALLHRKKELYFLLCYGLERCDLKEHPHYRGTFEMKGFEGQIINELSSPRAEEDMEQRRQLRQVTVAATMAFMETVEHFFEDGEDDHDQVQHSDEDSDEDGSIQLDSSPTSPDDSIFVTSTKDTNAFCKYMKRHGAQTLHQRAFEEYLREYIELRQEPNMQSFQMDVDRRVFEEFLELHPELNMQSFQMEVGGQHSVFDRTAFEEYLELHPELHMQFFQMDVAGPHAFEEYLEQHPELNMPSFQMDRVGQHSVFQDYFNDRDFNFLPPEEYLFHFLCGDGNNLGAEVVDTRIGSKAVRVSLLTTLWTAISAWQGTDALWKFVLQFKDGQGRPPFHVAVDGLSPNHFIDLVMDNDYTREAVARDIIVLLATTVDDGDRTPVYRAAATGREEAVRRIVELGNGISEVAETCYRTRNVYGITDWDASRTAEFSLRVPLAHTPLHAAMIHKNFCCAKRLLKADGKNFAVTYKSSDKGVYQQTDEEGDDEEGDDAIVEDVWFGLGIVEFAIIARAPDTLIRHLSKVSGSVTNKLCEISKDMVMGSHKKILLHPWHPLHLAASLGRYNLVEFLLDLDSIGRKVEPLIEDYEGNSALHHAMKIREFELHTHLFDYVNSEHCYVSKNLKGNQMEKERVLDDNLIAERQGCINRLLQEGCDVFKISNNKKIPYPRGSLKDKRFLSWWYNKQEKEFTAAQSNLNFATNAIAVTATLVATASYVGPLQPPMGYNSNQIQYQNVWVSIFIVCDSLSFYLAIIAITLSLIPSLSVPQQAMKEELQRARGMVILAVGILLPSIICVSVAFASSSISVMSTTITSETGGILTIVSTCLGALFCFIAFGIFVIRLVTYIFPKNRRIRRMYELSNYITKFSVVT